MTLPGTSKAVAASFTDGDAPQPRSPGGNCTRHVVRGT